MQVGQVPELDAYVELTFLAVSALDGGLNLVAVLCAILSLAQ